MTEKIERDAEPTANLIEFRRSPRVPTIEIQTPKWDACKHVKTVLIQENRTVECRDCQAVLDPFTVLTQLASRERQWMSELDRWEAYRDSQLAARYDEKWAQDHEGEVRRPADPEAAAIWDVFATYFGRTKGQVFVRMYRRRARKRNGPDWYGVSSHGGNVSYEYARAQLVPKLVK